MKPLAIDAHSSAGSDPAFGAEIKLAVSGRISDERIARMLAETDGSTPWVSVVMETPQARATLIELQHSRALVTELRALAERMRRLNAADHDPATRDWLSEIDSLLSAHSQVRE